MTDRIHLRRASTAELSPDDIAALRSLLWTSFEEDGEGFVEDDWEHALGGRHVIGELDGQIVAHASVVERDIRLGGRPLRAGYVEAVAVEPSLQGRGLGSRVMAEITAHIRAHHELGVLGTGAHRFYERLGWRTWQGPSGVRVDGVTHPTPDEDGYILVLETPTSPPLDLDEPIECDWRPGDVW